MAARSRPPMDTPDEIEAEFYAALRGGELDRLMAVWGDEDEIVCVHPGGPRVTGALAIRASFESIFANGGIPVQVERVRRLSGAACAVHSVLEQVRVIDPRDPRGAQTAWVLATNVYLKSTHGWRLVAHHASPGSPREIEEAAEAGTTIH